MGVVTARASMLLLVPPAVGLVEGLFMDDDELPRTLVCCAARRNLIFRPALALAHALGARGRR